MRNIPAILRDNDFRFNKQFGQNFITDTNLLTAMVKESGIESGDTVLEIGAGAGTLTRAIAQVAGKVVAYEIDNRLQPILQETLQGLDNVTVCYQDFMKTADEELAELVGSGYRVVANLPYYITTPIIMRLLESANPPKSISIMVQKEVAERITSTASHSDYGSITVSIDLVADATIARIVKKEMFYPVPKVDSAVLRIDCHPDKYPCDIDYTKKIIKAAFIMRRKTLSNNLTMAGGYSREKVLSVLATMGLDERIRGEALTTAQFVELAKLLKQ